MPEEDLTGQHRLPGWPASLLLDGWRGKGLGRRAGAWESARGRKANISYVDRAINKEFFNTVIKHCTIGFPYRGFLFFGEGELNEYDT